MSPSSHFRTNRSEPKRRGIVLCAVLLLAAGTVGAFVNEAISFALEAATPYVEQGFEVREDNWSGEVEPGLPLLVKHQLFRGNEYWFWAGTSWPGATIRVDAYDQMGEPIGLESFSKNGRAGVRVLPEKTDVYFIRVIADYDKDSDEAKAAASDPALDPSLVGKPESLDWGLTYGYR